MYQMLRQKNRAIAPQVIELARDLVRIPSKSLHEGGVAAVVEEQMIEIGYDKVFRDEAGNVIGLLLGREAEPTVLLNCHMDTVDAGPASSATPEAGTVREGQLYGPGAADCKAGLAAQVFVGDLIKRSLLPLKGNLVVAATVAEENGRSIGVRTLMEKTLPQLKIKPTYAILGEPTNLGLYYGHDGWIEMDICIRGANPFQVDDAASAIFEDLRSARNSDGGAEGLSLRRPRFEDEGGIRRATIGLERRLIGDDAADEVLGRVRHEATLVAQSVGAVAVEVAVRQDTQRLYTGRTTMVRHVAHAWTTDPFHPLMERARQALGAAGCQVRPGKFQLGRMGMGTAGSVLVDQFQVPAIAYGPGDETVAHTADEYVKTDSVVEAVYGTAAIVHSLVGIPVFGWTSDEI